MEVSSSTPDDAPQQQPLMSEANAVSPTTADAARDPQSAERETITEETATTPASEVNMTPKTIGVTVTPDTSEETSTTPITEETSTPVITELNITPEVTITPQETEVTLTSEVTEGSNAREIPAGSPSPQDSEIKEENITSDTAEETSPADTAVETSPADTAAVTTADTADLASPADTAEETYPADTAVETSPADTAVETSPADTAVETYADTAVETYADTAVETSPADFICTKETTALVGSAVEVSSSADIGVDVQSLQTAPERSTDLISEEKPSHIVHPSPSYELTPVSAPASAPSSAPASASQFLSDLWDYPPVASQDSTNLTMDSFGKNSPGSDPDVLNQSDDDFMFEMKNNSFQAFSPVSDASEALGEIRAARRSVEVSDSPSPDLVQDAYDGDEDISQPQEIKQLDTDEVTSHSYVQQLGSSDLFSNVNKEGDDRPMSLPDILKSSPLNPDKVDSGSSEGSPEFSPVHRGGNDSPKSQLSVYAINQLGLDSKILLLKEMAEQTEAKAAKKAQLETETISEQSFVAFDLVKETDVPSKSDKLLKDKEDAEMLSQVSVPKAGKFECLNFPTGKAQEHSDSESPSADSFSPVLDAMAKKTSGFLVEQENTAVREEIEAIDEVSEQEASSEEFEFVERPPRGATDEFLEIQDGLTLMKPSEMLVDNDQSPSLEPQATYQMPATQDANDQSSYHLLSQLSHKSSPEKGKAGLESDFQEISPAFLICTPVDKTGVEKMEAAVRSVPSLRAAAVLELLYWRDVKSSAAVFISSLILLLSISIFSIISVLSYMVMALLSVTVSFRVYKGVLQAIQKSDEGHPFKQYLDQDVALSKDVVQKYSDVALCRINSGLIELRRLFLVEDLVDSLKFAVFLWILTYVGALFNGLTLLILGLVGAFSFPVIYEKHQTEIDQYTSVVLNQLKDIMGKIQAKVPGSKKLE